MRRLLIGTKLYTEDMDQCAALEIRSTKFEIRNNIQIQNDKFKTVSLNI